MSHSFIAISLKLDFNDLDLSNFIDHHLVVSSKCINQYIEKCTTFNDVYIFFSIGCEGPLWLRRLACKFWTMTQEPFHYLCCFDSSSYWLIVRQSKERTGGSRQVVVGFPP